MTGRVLHFVAPHDLPAPRVDDDSLEVLNDAIDTLAALRTTYWLGDSSVRLHALVSLITKPKACSTTPSTTPATSSTPGTNRPATQHQPRYRGPPLPEPA